MIAFMASWTTVSSSAYAEKCANDGTVIIAYFEDGVVRGAAELHPPEQSPDAQPEIAFSVEASARRKGVGSILFKKLIAEAHARGYRGLRITTGAQNEAMRTLANKFGAKLTFHHGRVDRQHRPGAAQRGPRRCRCRPRMWPRSKRPARSRTSTASIGGW